MAEKGITTGRCVLKSCKLTLLVVIVATWIVLSESDHSDIFMKTIDPPSFCKQLAANTTRSVLKSASQCSPGKKKSANVSGGIKESSTRTLLECLQLIQEDALRIEAEDVHRFVTKFSPPGFVEVGKIVVADCIEAFNSIAEDTKKNSCTPIETLVRCMQENLNFVVSHCNV